ncbi:MAG: hypothetical protein H0W64_11115 [Gammaproteobacteria bacterium]|nr:hypothetical protein [Gammaproteobacteria bacterium]
MHNKKQALEDIELGFITLGLGAICGGLGFLTLPLFPAAGSMLLIFGGVAGISSLGLMGMGLYQLGALGIEKIVRKKKDSGVLSDNEESATQHISSNANLLVLSNPPSNKPNKKPTSVGNQSASCGWVKHISHAWQKVHFSHFWKDNGISNPAALDQAQSNQKSNLGRKTP